MIRLTLILIAGLAGAMLIWGSETPDMRAEVIEKDVLAAPKPEQPVESVTVSPVDTDPATAVETAEAVPDVAVETIPDVTRLDSIDFTSLTSAGTLLVVDAPDAPADAITPEPAQSVVPAESTTLLVVTGSSVNMRAGPSTTQDIVGNLRRGARAELVAEAPDGWLQIRAVDDGQVGYMAAQFLQSAN